jgi:hypothetical protein
MIFSRCNKPACIAVAVVTLRRVSLLHKRRLILHKERSHIFHCDTLDNDPESGELTGKKQ